MKYKVQISMYGTVAERADIIVEAYSEKDAQKIAEKKLENHKEGNDNSIIFTNNQEATDGWEYQIEHIEEVK